MESSGHIRFNCEHLRRKGKYSLERLDARQRRILERKLRDYEKHTTESFENSKGVGLQEIAFDQWKNAPSKHQQRQVREEVSGDVPEDEPVVRFRVSGKMRVFLPLAAPIGLRHLLALVGELLMGAGRRSSPCA